MSSPAQPNHPPDQSPESIAESSLDRLPEVSGVADAWMPVKDAAERWSIKSAAFYERMKVLGLKATRQGKKSFLSPDQVALLDQLDAHINHTGSMQGFGALVTTGTAPLEEADPAIAVEAEAQELELNQGFEAIVRSAQEHAAGSLIAKYMLSAELQNRPDLLPEELRTQVTAAQQKAAPKSQSPQAIAAGIMNQFRHQIPQPANA
jgi:hypothetical protein